MPMPAPHLLRRRARSQSTLQRRSQRRDPQAPPLAGTNSRLCPDRRSPRDPLYTKSRGTPRPERSRLLRLRVSTAAPLPCSGEASLHALDEDQDAVALAESRSWPLCEANRRLRGIVPPRRVSARTSLRARIEQPRNPAPLLS